MILNDELLEPTSRTETRKTVEKGERYRTHVESIVTVEDRCHCVEVKPKSVLPGFFRLGGKALTDNGYIKPMGSINFMGQKQALSSTCRPHRTKQMSSLFTLLIKVLKCKRL